MDKDRPAPGHGSPDPAPLGRRPAPRHERPAHPQVAAALLMCGIVLLLVLVSVMEVR